MYTCSKFWQKTNILYFDLFTFFWSFQIEGKMMFARNSIKTPAHQHKLSYVNTSEYLTAKGITGWQCDACRRTSKELQTSHSYRCIKCDFDLCTKCPKSMKTEKHPHLLKVTDTTNLCDIWSCDNCGTTSVKEGP